MCRCWCLFCACVGRPKYGRSTTGMANMKTPFEHGLIWRLWSYNTRSLPVPSHRSEQQLPVWRTMDGAEICGRKCGLVASLQCHQAMHGKLWHTHTHCHPIRGKLDRAGGGRQNAFGAERPEAHGSARCYPWVNGYGKPAFVDVFSLLHTWLSHCQAKLLQGSTGYLHRECPGWKWVTRNRFDDRRGGGRGRDGMPGCRLMLMWVMCHGTLVVGLHMFTQDAII